MRTNQFVKTSLLAVTAASMLVACTKLQWIVKYQDTDPYYSTANTTAFDAQGNAYLGGYVEPRDAGRDGRVSFVAKYDANGTLLWDRRFTESPDEPLRGINRLLTDADENVYIVEMRYSASQGAVGLQVTKLDNAGNELWQWYGYTPQTLPWQIRADIRNDGNFYVTGTMPGTMDLVTLSPGGDLLWTLPSQPVSVDHGDLSPFPGRLAAAAASANYTARNLGTQLELISASGELLEAFTVAQLGFERILNTVVSEDVTLVVGALSSGGIVARRINATDTGFILDGENTLTLSPVITFASKAAADGFCFATMGAGSIITTGYVDANLQLRWQHATTPDDIGAEVDVMDVEATSDSCYTQYYTARPQKLNAVVISESITTGRARAPIVMNDFGAYDLAAQGKAILQAGITGPYTGNEGTAATLSKHTFN